MLTGLIFLLLLMVWKLVYVGSLHNVAHPIVHVASYLGLFLSFNLSYAKYQRQ